MLQNKKQKQIKRSKLSKVSFIKWFRTRYHNQNRPNNHYLYFPQQLMLQTSYQKIFKEFDSDGSGGLSRDQVLVMFNGFGIPITMEDLNLLYDSIQPELQEMDCQMFKKCSLSQKPTMVFRQIVQNLGEGYLPHNFTNMVIYLVYLSKREQLKKAIEAQQMPIKSKIENVQNLLKLKNLQHNNERLTNHAQGFKHSIKMKFRNIWEKINQNYGDKYPFTPKLQEQFFQYYKNRKN